MIYARLKIFGSFDEFDIKLRKEAGVKDVIRQLTGMLDIECGRAFLVSCEQERILRGYMTIMEEGISCGDTLILLV